MGRNIEIKARVRHPRRLREKVEELADRGPVELRQVDTFFPSARGRLKLRQRSDGVEELIFYQRPDASQPAGSEFLKVPTAHGEQLLEALGRSLGIRGEVRKERCVFLVGPTRIHLDEVEGLGAFLELEVVLGPEDSAESGVGVARRLMAELEVEEGDLVEGAYIDLLEEPG